MSFKKINKIRKSKRTRLVCICACLLLLLAGCKNTVSATPDSEDKSNNSSTVSETNPVSETAGSVSENAPKVYLDRPFIYMIVDCEYKLPVFIGTVMEP